MFCLKGFSLSHSISSPLSPSLSVVLSFSLSHSHSVSLSLTHPLSPPFSRSIAKHLAEQNCKSLRKKNFAVFKKTFCWLLESPACICRSEILLRADKSVRVTTMEGQKLANAFLKNELQFIVSMTEFIFPDQSSTFLWPEVNL